MLFVFELMLMELVSSESVPVQLWRDWVVHVRNTSVQLVPSFQIYTFYIYQSAHMQPFDMSSLAFYFHLFITNYK